MLAFQAFANACIFAVLTALLAAGGGLSKPTLVVGSLTGLFVLSLATIKRFGRWPLVITWVLVIVLISPHLPGGMMDGGIVGYPIFLYMIAGFLGACFLPKRGFPSVPGAPTE